MNVFGLLVGVATLLVIGMGFPLVIIGERYFGYLWWPYLLGFGILSVLSSLFIQPDWISALTGIVGATLVWGSTELNEQARRAEAGWFPRKARKIRPPFERIINKWKAPRL